MAHNLMGKVGTNVFFLIIYSPLFSFTFPGRKYVR